MKLKNQRHESFANLIAKGEAASLAYKKIYKGTTTKASEANGSRLIRNDRVIARVKELQDMVESDTVMTLQEMLEYCATIARSPFSKLREDSPILQSIKTTKRLDPDGSDGELEDVIEYKVPDKLRAVELAAKLKGFLRDKVEHTGANGAPIAISANVVTEDRRAQLMAKKKAAIERRKGEKK